MWLHFLLLAFGVGVTQCIIKISYDSQGLQTRNDPENITDISSTENLNRNSSKNTTNLGTNHTNALEQNINHRKESMYNYDYNANQTNPDGEVLGKNESINENSSMPFISSSESQEKRFVNDIFLIDYNNLTLKSSNITLNHMEESLTSSTNLADEIQKLSDTNLNSEQQTLNNCSRTKTNISQPFNLAHQTHETKTAEVEHDASHLTVEYRLINDLLSQYNKNIRPVTEAGSISHIFVELSLFDVLKLDTKHQVLQTNTEFIMKWEDIHLKWDPTKYDNISIIRLPYEIIWYPDIILYNTAEPDYQSSIMYTNAIVRASGEVELVSHSIFSSICNVDIQWYPFDQQDCVLIFASWTYDELDIHLILGPADISDYHKNPEYTMENFYGEQQQTFNPCCTYPMSTIVYHLQLQRRTKFSLFFYLMPGILINLSAVMVFSLPAESGEKIGLGINSLLAMTVFLMAMTEKLPPTEKIPLAGLYYGVCLTVITINIAFSVFILNLNFAGDRNKKIPEWVKQFIIWLIKILRNRIPESVYHDWNIDRETKQFRNRYPIKDIFTADSMNMISTIGKQKKEIQREMNDDHAKGYEDLKDLFQRRVIHALEFMAENSKKTVSSIEKQETKENLRTQWKFISRVLDRLLFVIFFSIAFVFNIVILTSSPFDERFEYCPIGHGQCDGMTREEIVELAKQMALTHAKGHG